MARRDLHRLWQQLTSPRAAAVDEVRREYVTKVVLVVLVIVNLGLTLAAAVGWGPGHVQLETLSLALAMAVGFGGALWLANVGHWQVAGLAPPVIIFGVALYGSVVGGVDAPATVLYAVAIVLTAILQGEHRHWITLGLAIAAWIGLGWADVSGWLPASRTLEGAFANRVAIVVTSYCGLAFLIYFPVRQFRLALAETREYALLLAERSAELSRINSQLEQEIAERRQAEAAVQAEQAFLRGLIDAVPAFICVKNLAGEFELANAALARAYGTTADQMIGRKDAHFSPLQSEIDHFLQNDQEVILRARPKTIPEEKITYADGQVHWHTTYKIPLTEPDGSCHRLLAVSADITERKQSEEALRASLEQLRSTQAQLVQAAKLAVVGELAAGVAHELANPLTAVLGFAELLLRTQPAEAPGRRELETIVKEARRAREIVHHLLNFARQTKPERQPLNINQLLQETLALIRQYMQKNNISIDEKYDPHLPAVTADEAQVKQVFLNLITNASQAMPDGGTMTICTQHMGDQVAISVSDNGLGIPVEIQARIFDPSFRISASGEGTRLGLAVSQRLMQQHGGRITLDSQVGQGTTFTVWLPVNPPKPAPKVAMTD
mgnify:CR=1 FL=1